MSGAVRQRRWRMAWWRRRQIARAKERWATLRSDVKRLRAEILQGAAIFGGWASLTYGIAALTTSRVWPISFGLLLLSLAGWQFLGTLFWRGLYVITQRGPRRA
jgi:hypothetical protein